MIIVHHLNFSRSTRVLWLLEELGLDYEIARYERLPGFRAPPSLAAIHPHGKAPVVELDGQIVAESAVILSAIHSRYGEGALVPPPGAEALLLHEEWLQSAESSIALPLMMALFGKITGGLPDLLERVVATNVRHVLDRVESGSTPGPFIMGDRFTLADIQMVYLVDLARYLGLLSDRPRLLAYLLQFASRPAFVRALSIGGPMMPPA